MKIKLAKKADGSVSVSGHMTIGKWRADSRSRKCRSLAAVEQTVQALASSAARTRAAMRDVGLTVDEPTTGGQ